MEERRQGIGAVPPEPKLFVNDIQVRNLLILKKFGWNLVCIRRQNEHHLDPAVILTNRSESRVGIIDADGILRLSSDLKIRNFSRHDRQIMNDNTDFFLRKCGLWVSSESGLSVIEKIAL